MLDRIEELIAEATPGPWYSDYGKIGVGEDVIGEMDYKTDGAFVAHARQLLPLMLSEMREWRAMAGSEGEFRGTGRDFRDPLDAYCDKELRKEVG